MNFAEKVQFILYLCGVHYNSENTYSGNFFKHDNVKTMLVLEMRA